jgi:hypothetical protein
MVALMARTPRGDAAVALGFTAVDVHVLPEDARRLCTYGPERSAQTMDASANHLSPGSVPRCGACNDVIGVYEPLVRVHEDSVRHTSRAAEPLLRGLGECWYHLGCYESLDHEL